MISHDTLWAIWVLGMLPWLAFDCWSVFFRKRKQQQTPQEALDWVKDEVGRKRVEAMSQEAFRRAIRFGLVAGMVIRTLVWPIPLAYTLLDLALKGRLPK